MRAPAVLGAALLALALAGCRSSPAVQSPYAPASDAPRNQAEAERLAREAADLIEGDPGRAEVLLRQALTADLFSGPAHNNLGVIHLKRGELYQAASEFEWARKLMPGHPDPRLNLALTLEKAGQIEEALSAYGAALEVMPGYLPAVQGMARLHVREGKADTRLDGWLRRIALEGETEAWRRWATRRRAAE